MRFPLKAEHPWLKSKWEMISQFWTPLEEGLVLLSSSVLRVNKARWSQLKSLVFLFLMEVIRLTFGGLQTRKSCQSPLLQYSKCIKVPSWPILHGLIQNCLFSDVKYRLNIAKKPLNFCLQLYFCIHLKIRIQLNLCLQNIFFLNLCIYLPKPNLTWHWTVFVDPSRGLAPTTLV